VDGAGLGAGVGGMVGEEEVTISGQFNRAESPTLSSGVNRLVSLAPLSLAVSSLVKRAVSLAGPLGIIGILGVACAAATCAPSPPLLFDKLTDNPTMNKMATVPAMIHPVRLLAWGWLDDGLVLLDAEVLLAAAPVSSSMVKFSRKVSAATSDMVGGYSYDSVLSLVGSM